MRVLSLWEREPLPASPIHGITCRRHHCYAQDSSGIDRWSLPARREGWDSTGSGLQPTSWHRWPGTRDAASLRSRSQGTPRARSSLGRWEPSGPEDPTRILRRRSTRRSSSLPWVWGERVIRSVANLTRRDGEEFLRIAPAASVRTDTQPYSLPNANEALTDLREGRVTGAAVLLVGGEA